MSLNFKWGIKSFAFFAEEEEVNTSVASHLQKNGILFGLFLFVFYYFYMMLISCFWRKTHKYKYIILLHECTAIQMFLTLKGIMYFMLVFIEIPFESYCCISVVATLHSQQWQSHIVIIYGLSKADVYSQALNYTLESHGVWASWYSV